MSFATTIAIAALAILATPRKGRAAKKWGYKGRTGPIHWAKIDPAYSQCKHGTRQTPIDIHVDKDIGLPPLDAQYTIPGDSIVNDGHTLQVRFPPGNALNANDKQFALIQAHFHAPGENYFNGRSYPFETHLVHQDATGGLAVLAVLYEIGKENPGIAQLWKHMPYAVNAPAPIPEGFTVESILPKSRDVVYFEGSLTTPPCDEGVRWYVLKEFPQISKEQIQKFSRAIGSANNRPLQPHNDRVIMD